MKIKPSTLFLILAALLLGGIVLIVQQQPAPKSADNTKVASDEESPIFKFQEADVQTLSLQTQLRSLKFERDPNGKWQMTQPEKTAANPASVAFLLNLVTTGKTERILTVPESDREQFGLHQPLATIEVGLKDQTQHKLVLGEYDFNRGHLYAQADPPESSKEINLLLVSPNFENAVSRPFSDWKQTSAEKSAAPSPASPAEKSPAPSPQSSSEPSSAPSPESSPDKASESPSPTPSSSASPAPDRSEETQPQSAPNSSR